MDGYDVEFWTLSVKFPCGLCDYQATEKSSLSKHNKTVHSADQMAKQNCDFCDFQSVYKTALTKHRKLLHSGNAEVFECNVCTFKTNNKYRLANHAKRKHISNDPKTGEAKHTKKCLQI